MSDPLERGLPCALDAERLILGAVQVNDERYWDPASVLVADDFSLMPHRQIWAHMGEIHARGERIDRIVLINELQRSGQLASVGGMTYLAELDTGIPQLSNIDGYVRLVQEKAALRRTIFAAQALMNRCLLDEEPAADILAAHQKAIRAIADGDTKHGEWLQPCEVLEQWPGGIAAFLDPPRGGVGIPTPWPNLTECLAGLHRGDLFVVAGRPSMGKSIIGMQMAFNAAASGYGAALFSLEMTKESLTQRLLAGIARVDSQRLRTGGLIATDKARISGAVDTVDRLPLWIDDTRARTVPAMLAALRRLAGKHEVSLIVIDHLQLMTTQGRGRENRNQELTDILHDLKHEAGRLNAVVVLLSQLNRLCEIENRRPQLSDLKETGTIEEDADVVLFVHRPERYMKNAGRPELRGVAEFIVAKQRNGPTGKKDMVFLSECQRFDMAADTRGWNDGED